MAEQNAYVRWPVITMLVVASISFLQDRANAQSRYEREMQCYKQCKIKSDDCQKLNKPYSPRAFDLCDRNYHSCVNNCKRLYVEGSG